MGTGGEEVDGFAGRGQLRIGLAEPFGEPEVDARLVAKLDRRVGRETRGDMPDGAILGLVAEVGVEVEDIDILDAMEKRAPGQVVPDLVVDRTRDDPGVGEVKVAEGLQLVRQVRALRDDVAQSPVLGGGVFARIAEVVDHSPG